MGTVFRKATNGDFEAVWQIMADAKRLMAARGSSQWTAGYPAQADIESDLRAGCAYVACDDGGRTVGYACIAESPEPAYGAIEGRWLAAGPYVTVHQLAVAAAWRRRGVARALMAWAEGVGRACGAASVRVDTNHDNAAMLRLLPAMGYARCGTVSYGPRGERIAFEKLL